MSPIEMTAIRSVRPAERNARTHPKKQIKQIADSIKRFGWTYPLLVDERGYVLAGHGRLQAAKLLGLREVPIIRLSGLSDAEKSALALADNKISANAGWDRLLLAEQLAELVHLPPEFNLPVEVTGFEPAEIDALLGDFSDSETDPADEIPSPAQIAVSTVSDLWQLGPHRLLCGNARNAVDVRKLMGRERAAMVFTDPPYNVRVSSVQGRGKIRHREFKEASGEFSAAEFTEFLVESLALAAEYSDDGSIHYICMDWRHMGEMLAAGNQAYGSPKNLVVWTKTHGGMGTFYRSQHELIFVFKNGDASHVNNFELGQHGRNRSNVWTYAGVNTFRTGRLDDLAIHPTVKPVGMVADAMKDCSHRGDIALDMFIGSGTTILAAEKVGRRAYGLEIDPLYVDVAIRRWQSFTKRDAILEATGQTFDEISGVRAQVAETHSAEPRTRVLSRVRRRA